jgi:hypothetical protein
MAGDRNPTTAADIFSKVNALPPDQIVELVLHLLRSSEPLARKTAIVAGMLRLAADKLEGYVTEARP